PFMAKHNKMKNQQSPVNIKISFKKLVEEYENQLKIETKPISKEYLKNILEYAKSFPKLIEGFESGEELDKHREPIKTLLTDLFPDILTKYEIKVASVPFGNLVFHCTQRFSKIMSGAGKDFRLEARDLSENMQYVR